MNYKEPCKVMRRTRNSEGKAASHEAAAPPETPQASIEEPSKDSGGEDTAAALVRNGEKLLERLRYGHEARRLEDAAPAHQVLLALLLRLDVQQRERVQLRSLVLQHGLEEAVRLPVFRPVRDGDRRAETVELEPDASHRVHDGRVVDHAHLPSGEDGVVEG